MGKWLERKRLREKGVRYVRWNTARKHETRVAEDRSSLTPGTGRSKSGGERRKAPFARSAQGKGQEEARCRDTLSISEVNTIQYIRSIVNNKNGGMPEIGWLSAIASLAEAGISENGWWKRSVCPSRSSLSVPLGPTPSAEVLSFANQKGRLKTMESTIKVGQRFKFTVLTDNTPNERQGVVVQVLSNREEGLGLDVDEYMAYWIEAHELPETESSPILVFVRSTDGKVYLDGKLTDVTVLP